MKLKIIGIIIIILVLAAAGSVYWKKSSGNKVPDVINNNATSTKPSVRLEYKNDQYGFSINLPTSWTGYTIVMDKWIGNSTGNQGEQKFTEGPLISVRHPLWTVAVPRQDIPVMVFTLSQWQELQNDKFHIGAAPIGPSELGRNAKFVFALPARYNYAFPAGFEEVDKIIGGNNFKAF
jgi:hypothetical protein